MAASIRMFNTEFNPVRGDLVYGISPARKAYDAQYPAKTKARMSSRHVWAEIDYYNRHYQLSDHMFTWYTEPQPVEKLMAEERAWLDPKPSESRWSWSDWRAARALEKKRDPMGDDPGGEKRQRLQGQAFHDAITASRFAPARIFDVPPATLDKEIPVAEPGGVFTVEQQTLSSRRTQKQIRRSCKFGLALVAVDPAFVSYGARVHFLLDGLDIRGIADDTPRDDLRKGYVPITTSELRYAFRYWRELSGAIIFYVDREEVAAPWLEDWRHASITGVDITVATVESARDAWVRYGQRRQERLGADLATRTLLGPH